MRKSLLLAAPLFLWTAGACVVGTGGGGGTGGGVGSCGPDATVTGCMGSDGYSCPAGSQPPDATDTTLICSDPVASGPDDIYCCYTSPTFPAGTCAYDQTLDQACDAMDTGALGYSCQGTDTPEQTDSSLTCSVDQGNGQFCCTTGGGGGGCGPDATVTGCMGSDGYSCPAGSQPPDATDTTLICSDPAPSGSSDAYCCYTSPTFPAGTCAYDQTLDQACDATNTGALGYSCQGTDTPDQSDASLTCSADQGTGQFCCTTN
jgi:hypothetical protein